MFGTIAVGTVLLAIVSLIIFSMVKSRRSGKHVSSCGGNCSACGCCCACAKKNKSAR